MQVWIEDRKAVVSCIFSEKEIVKAVGNYKFNKVKKVWEFPMSSIISIIDNLKIESTSEVLRFYEMLKVQESERKKQIQKAEKIKTGKFTSQYKSWDVCFSHQKQALALATLFDSYFLAMDVGTGKSMTTIKLIEHWQVPAMIVAPLSILESVWIAEIAKWSKLTVVNLWHNLKALDKNYDVYLINYEHFKKIKQLPGKIKYLICDESSKLKSYKSQITKKLLEYKDTMPHKLLLSGKPAPNSLLEYWSQAAFINSNLLGDNFFKFRNTYFYSTGYGGYIYQPFPSAREAIMNKVAEQAFFIKKEDCLSGYTMVETNKGNVYIRDIVNNKLKLKVKSFNNLNKKIEWQPITNFWKRKASKIFIRIYHNGINTFNSAGKMATRIECTPDHKIYTNKGYKLAKDIQIADLVQSHKLTINDDLDKFIKALLLGDGTCQYSKSNKSSCWLGLTHCKKQKYYLIWKRKMLKGLCPSVIWTGSNTISNFKTLTYECIVKYRELFYPNGKKIIPIKILNEFDYKHFAIWFMDDGHLSFGSGRKRDGVNFVLAVCSLEKTNVQEIQRFFLSKFAWKSWLINDRGYYNIRFNKKSTENMINVFSPYLIYNKKRIKTFICNDIVPNKFLKEESFFRKIIKVKIITHKNNIPSFDLTINKNHNYFSNGILVHNCLDLPEQVFQIRLVEMDAVQQKAYDDMKKDNIMEFKDHVTLGSSELAKIMKLRQISGGFCITTEGNTVKISDTKLTELMNVLDEIADDKQVLIWVPIHFEVHMITEALKKARKSYASLYGDMKQKEKEQVTEDFKNKKVTYLVSHPKSGGMGLNLQQCSYCVWFSMSYSEEEFYQANNRIHRPGQTNKCTYILLHAKRSIDIVIYKALLKKEKMTSVCLSLLKGNAL